MLKKSYVVAIVGATGAVGTEMRNILAERDFPITELRLLSSARSAGKKLPFKGEEITITEATPESFQGVDIALFSAGGDISKELAPKAVEAGVIVIDNTSAFRMDTDVPLVVPEVNEADLKSHKGIIANPNCTTIQMVVALEPIRQKYGLERVVVSTYQSVSGAGAAAVDELYTQSSQVLNKEKTNPSAFAYQIAYNVIPQIDQFGDDDYTLEELKIMNETKKIMHLPNLRIAATSVRLPVETGHSESVYLETALPVDVANVKSLLTKAPGVTVQDDPSKQLYPMPLFAAGEKEVFVGRMRKDRDNERGMHMWIVSDNLLKGAAWNSVQIAESLLKLDLI